MLRFAFKPRHPITRVAFTADGREVITAQPFTGIAVRDRLTGEARVTFPLPKSARFYALGVHPELGWIVVHSNRGAELFDPATGQSRLEHNGSEHPAAPRQEEADFFIQWRRTGGGVFVQIPAARIAPTRFDSEGVRIAQHVTRLIGLWARYRGRPYLVDHSGAGHSLALNSPLRLGHLLSGRLVVAFSPAGDRVAVGDGELLNVFDVPDVFDVPGEFPPKVNPRHVIQPFFTLDRPDPTRHGTFADKQAEHWLPSVAFDHAGRTMFTLGLRNRVQRIDLATGGVMGEWGWRCEPIRSLAVAPDDLTAAAGCQRGELVLWDLE